jgi:predicted RNase H-like HicB family nuclease
VLREATKADSAYLAQATLNLCTEMPEEEGFYGSIPDLQGVWANAPTLEECREELRQVLEEWLVLGLRKGHPIPEIDGINFNIEEVV